MVSHTRANTQAHSVSSMSVFRPAEGQSGNTLKVNHVLHVCVCVTSSVTAAAVTTTPPLLCPHVMSQQRPSHSANGGRGLLCEQEAKHDSKI